MTIEIREFLLNLLDAGDLTPPVEYLGEDLFPRSTAPSSGWDFTNRHAATGCPRSSGVDALRTALTNQGRRDLVALLPEYHCGDFWSNFYYQFGFGPTAEGVPDKFEFPKDAAEALGFTSAQAGNVVKNLVKINNMEFLFTLMQGRGWMDNMFRGSQWADGFTPEDIVYGNGAGRGRPQPETPVRPGVHVMMTAPDGTELTNHYVYDIYFHTATDEDVTRYWTSWARAWGAKV